MSGKLYGVNCKQVVILEREVYIGQLKMESGKKSWDGSIMLDIDLHTR